MNGAFLGGLLGFGGSIAPAILDFFSAKNERKHVEEMAKLGHVFEYANKETAADVEESKNLLDHDKSLTTDSKFINMLRTSVRPVITYTFFLMFLLVKLTGVWVAWFVHSEPFAESMLAIWDPDTSALFAAVMGFWFGNRAIARYSVARTLQRQATPSVSASVAKPKKP